MLIDRQVTQLAEAVTPEDVGRLRHALLRLARDLRRTATETGFTPSELGVLNVLVRRGALRAGDVAAAEGINPTLASRVLNTLEQEGLVLRERDPEDGRATVVRATRAGHARSKQLRARRDAVLAERLAGLSEEHRAALLGALEAFEALAEVEA